MDIDFREFSAVAAAVLTLTLAGCEQEGPLERAGKDLDRAVDEVSDAVKGQGPLERMGERVDEALDTK